MNAVTSLETTESTVQYNQPLTLAKHVLFVPRSHHSLDLSSCEDTLYQSIERGGCIPKFASARSLFALLKLPASYWVFGSEGTLQQDNRQIIGRLQISSRLAVKYSTRVLAKKRSHSAAFFGTNSYFFLHATQRRNPQLKPLVIEKVFPGG